MIPRAPVETVPDRGSLEDLPLASLLLRLYRRRYGGLLSVSREGVEKRITLRDGVPVMAESNRPSESLGVQLMDAGRISRDDYARVVEAVRKQRCKEGAALLGLSVGQAIEWEFPDGGRRRLRVEDLVEGPAADRIHDALAA